ncbi:NAD(P)H-binding protein [Methanobrevibacter millerae]|uniref:NAD(P)H-binding n=1 Tax=Methanobrevibacter millerae TaxID=230361 RepID=A0A1G5X443_9EURY|nr:NAD(P)H-binding protein [Methanobrevibacter millerae]SDA65173.1 NAD(P)H-binding [Methanobrevibacter millerae]
MNIAILGATGKFGLALTARLLAVTDHKLTLLSRSAADRFEDNYRITARKIDATNAREIKKALKDCDLVYCAISGDYMPVIADNIINANPKRLIFMATVGIYNELENAEHLNVDNEPLQIPNQYAADLIEASGVDYTILRLGLLEFGDEDDFTITEKGEKVQTQRTTIESVEKVALEIIADPELYSRKSISITRKSGS